MAWIKIDHSTGTKPEVFMLAQKMSITRAEALGHLIAIWIWFDQVSDDGSIKGNKAMIDSLSREGFAEALEELNWLKETNGVLAIPNFCNHNGQTAKQRCQAQSRQQKYRNNAGSVTAPLPEKIREDKKREKKVNYQAVVDLWNSSNEIKAQRLTDKRRAAIRQLLNEYTIDQIKQVFQAVTQIPFLRGENDRGWRADLDYTLRPDKFLKILEGGWEAKKEQPTTTTEYKGWNNDNKNEIQ